MIERGPFSKRASFILFCVVLSGCATPQLQAVRLQPSTAPRFVHLDTVPIIAQTKNYCGPASLAMVLQWAGERQATVESVAPQVYTPGRRGSLQTDMVAAARRHGQLAIPITHTKQLINELAAGRPILVLRNLGLSWYPVWHYSVVIGYDLEQERWFLHSGQAKEMSVAMNVFERTWARGGYWGLVILPPDQLPVSVSAEDVATSIAALEDVAGSATTKIAYQKLVERAPENLQARIGLANALYGEGNYQKAIDQLQVATERHPLAAPAWHNLAIALKANKQIVLAQTSAKQALKLATNDQKTLYQDSFRSSQIKFD